MNGVEGGVGVARITRMTGAMLFAAGLPWLLLTQAPTARACPDCVIGRTARAQVWSDEWAFNLSAVLLPFAAVAAASFWAERSDTLARGKR